MRIFIVTFLVNSLHISTLVMNVKAYFCVTAIRGSETMFDAKVLCPGTKIVALGSLLSACTFPVVPPSVAGSVAAPVEERSVSQANNEGLTLIDTPPPPDYDRVMGEEFDAAMREGTNSALIRFIARHPDHPLADRARSLLSGREGLDTGVSPTDPDADIYAAFDRARRENTISALGTFIALHPNHPLAAEARRHILRLQHGKQ